MAEAFGHSRATASTYSAMAKPPPTVAEARRQLGVAPDATEGELRHAYREAAKHVHPDKTGGSGDEFVSLGQALEVALAGLASPARIPGEQPEFHEQGVVPPWPAPPPPGMKESERLDKHFFGTAFGSDKFDPRAWTGEASRQQLASGDPVQCVWRCKECPEASSVCCRLKPRKHSCVCGHKVEAHIQARGFACGSAGCKCPRLQFHVQQLGWEAKCRCKHHVRDHAASGAPPWGCTKRLPGRDQKPCPCKAFDVAWVCTCGHAWDQHETIWSVGVSKACFAREWVAQGLRPECVQEAEEKRSKWEAEAAALAAKVGAAEASQRMAAKAQRIGASMCAEARMHEAVEETLDGSRLPAPMCRASNAACADAVPNRGPKRLSFKAVPRAISSGSSCSSPSAKQPPAVARGAAPPPSRRNGYTEVLPQRVVEQDRKPAHTTRMAAGREQERCQRGRTSVESIGTCLSSRPPASRLHETRTRGHQTAAGVSVAVSVDPESLRPATLDAAPTST